MGDVMSKKALGVPAIVLAAGESSRMGRPKALLDWGGKPLVQHQVDELRAAGCDPIVVVVGHEATAITATIQCTGPCGVVVNDGYREGRASSVRVGARALADGGDGPDDSAGSDGIGAVVVASVDQPCRSTTVRTLIASYQREGGRIVVPRYEGRNGHPALFCGELLDDLGAVEESSEGLRAVRRREAAGTRFLDVEDAWVRLNLNTPEAYARAVAAQATSEG